MTCFLIDSTRGKLLLLRSIEEKMQNVKIRGSQGSWEAQVTYPDGRKEILPCVHQHFWKSGPSGPGYDDPWTPDLRKSAKFAKHVELIRSKGRVILTADKIDRSKTRESALDGLKYSRL